MWIEFVDTAGFHKVLAGYRNISIPQIGEIRLERSRRAKRISLSIKPFAGVRVAVPQGVSFEAAEAFARAQSDWIKRQLRKVAALEDRARRLKGARPIDRKAAREILEKRIAEMSRKLGLAYNRLYVRNQKTRWGSCSAKNNINLNINLVLLPAELMDYAIVHELVHTRIKNHSSAFWEALEVCLPGARNLDRRLNDYCLPMPAESSL